MKKTLLSRLAVILFTAAIAAVNNPVIAKPQNNRLDSLKRHYSYEVCRQYCNMNESELFQICKIFPEYFIAREYPYLIMPNYDMFSYDYGCPAKVTPAIGNCSDSLIACRAKLDSSLNKIYDLLMSDSIYNKTVGQMRERQIDHTDGHLKLMAAELRIREKYSTKHTCYKTTRNRPPAKPRIITPSPYADGGSTVHYTPRQYGKWQTFRHRYSVKQIAFDISYIDSYLVVLRQANLASLRVILDDHIRRGVPIDISWIPEQTLAEIEATKPVRQLKKQIKAIEKRQKQ